MTPRPTSPWDSQLRQHRIRFGIVTALEAVCLLFLGAPLGASACVGIALLWLVGRWLRYPSSSQLARAATQNLPVLGENLTAMVALTESVEKPSTRGSAQLIRALKEDINRQLPIGLLRSLVSLKPLLLLAVAAVGINLFQVGHDNISTPPSAVEGLNRPDGNHPPQPTAIDRLFDRVDNLAQLRALQDQLTNLPADILRQLPPYQRSLQSTVDKAAQLLDSPLQNQIETQRLLAEDLSDALAEFARHASAIPSLNHMAVSAQTLSQQYASRSQFITQGTKSQSSPEFVRAGETSPDQSPRGKLPPVIAAGQAWSAPIEKERDTAITGLGLFPKTYEPDILDHLQQLALQ